MDPHGLTFSWWGCHGLCLGHKPAELAHSFYSVLVSVSVLMALSTVFHSINSPDNCPLSHSVLSALFLPYWVLAGSPSRGGDVTVYVLDINQLSLQTLFIRFLCLSMSLWLFQLHFIP